MTIRFFSYKVPYQKMIHHQTNCSLSRLLENQFYQR
ncbi:unnamed protein product [Brassica oleracea var. botrytis]